MVQFPVRWHVLAWSIYVGYELLGALFVKGETKNKYIRIDYADILFVEGLKNYVSIHLPTQVFVTYQSLRQLEQQLPRPPFVRVHKSYIVSLNKIRMVDGNTLYIRDKLVPVGKPTGSSCTG